MSVDIRRRGWVQVVEASGDDSVRERVERLLDEGHTLIIVNLTGKPGLDGAVLEELVDCREHDRKDDIVIKLIVNADQRELVRATELDYQFETFLDEEEALDSFLPWDSTAGIP